MKFQIMWKEAVVQKASSKGTQIKYYKDGVIAIKNVPCLECDQCGKKYYTDEVAEKLETIVNTAKKLLQEITVIDYRQAS